MAPKRDYGGQRTLRYGAQRNYGGQRTLSMAKVGRPNMTSLDVSGDAWKRE